MKTICKAWVLAMAVSGIAVLGVAQTAKKPAFEVASIKSGESVGPTLQACICTTDAHQFTARKTTLYALIKTAYGIHSGPCDETHLPGYFNFDIQYAPGLNNPDQSSGSPSIFTAIQEQLGLKLEPARGQVEVLVIDSVSKPTEN
jgi:hypothetical protein